MQASYGEKLGPRRGPESCAGHGNMACLPHPSSPAFTYDAANQLATSDDSAGRTTYTYDGTGNLAIQAAPGGRTTNTWDAENRLLLVQAPAGVINTMTYSADGLRVHKVDSSGASNYLWDGLILLSESDAAGNTLAVYTQEPAQFGGLVSGRRKSGDVWVPSYYHYDGLGSTDRLTDGSQSVTDSYSYYAYGESAGSSGSTVNPFRWVGQFGYHYDSDSAQYYIRARHYDPLLARWLSEDPIAYGEGDGDLYRYALNSPIGMTDPSGLQGSQSDSCACCKKAVAKAPSRIGPEGNTCFISYECREGRNSCEGGRWGYTSEPVRRPRSNIYDISICLACGYGQAETQANLDHEVTNARQLCTRGHGRMACKTCVDLETPAYVISCKAKKPQDRRCVKCGVAKSCKERCKGQSLGQEPPEGCEGVVT